jgi:hypothetical protein
MDSSPMVITGELENHLTEICKAIHNFSFDVFTHRVTKHKDNLSDIREYIEKDQMYLTFPERHTLAVFLADVDKVIEIATFSQPAKRLSTANIQALLCLYSCWTNENFLPEDGPVDNKCTFLDYMDTRLAESA